MCGEILDIFVDLLLLLPREVGDRKHPLEGSGEECRYVFTLDDVIVISGGVFSEGSGEL